MEDNKQKFEPSMLIVPIFVVGLVGFLLYSLKDSKL
jgi:hypothetical protein